MTTSLDPVLDEVSADPVFVFSNHHSEAFVRALSSSPLEGTAVFFPIGSVREHGEAVADLGEAPGWRVLTTFVSPPIVEAAAEGTVEYVPIRTSVHAAFVRRRFADRHLVLVGRVPSRVVDGRCTFGLACPHAPLLFERADTTVAVTNDSIPVVRGPTTPTEAWDVRVSTDESLPTFGGTRTETHGEIGAHVASLVPDGATIQLGIGSIPGAVTAALGDHAGLTVHSGVVSDGVLDLLEAGAIDREAETPVLASLVIGGSSHFYERIDDHDLVRLGSAEEVQNPVATGTHETFVSINSAIEVDLAGQVNASHIGRTQYAAPGGILDFAEGAHNSADGRSIVAMEARAKPDIPKIVPEIAAGTPVDVPRTNVDHVVTEYGVATLRDRTPAERAEQLIGVAHPDDREELRAALRERRTNE